MLNRRLGHGVFDAWRRNGGGFLVQGTRPGCGAGGSREGRGGVGRLEEVVAREGKGSLLASSCWHLPPGLSGTASASLGFMHAVCAVSCR